MIRRILILGIALVVLGGGAFVAYKIYRRGEQRSGVFERAVSASRNGRVAEAESLLREVLRSDPGHQQARELLLELFFSTGRLDEAERFCREWEEGEPGAAVPARYRVHIAIGQDRLDDAVRLARSMADRQKEFAYSILATLKDLPGVRDDNISQRLEAAAIASALASATSDEDAQADALLLSGSILHEIAAFEPRLSARLRTQARRDLDAAAAANERAAQRGLGQSYKERIARIGLYSERPEDALEAANALRRSMTPGAQNEAAHMALASFHMRREEWTEALGSLQQLKGGYPIFRCLWWLQRAGRRDIALQLLDSPALLELPPFQLRRVDLLLQGSAEEKSRGLKEAEALLRKIGAGGDAVLGVVLALCRRGEAEAAVRMVDSIPGVKSDDPRVQTVLAAVLTRQEKEPGRGEAIVKELLQTIDLSTDTGRQVLQLSGLGGGELLRRFVDVQVEKGGEQAADYRLMRLVALGIAANREKDEAKAKEARARLADDLKALLANAGTGKGALLQAAESALQFGEPEIAGRLLARAIATPGAPEGIAGLPLDLARAMPEGDFVKTFAAGMRAQALETPAGAFVAAIADAAAARAQDLNGLAERLLRASEEPGSRLPCLRLAGGIYYQQQAFDRAEECAGRILAEQPADTDGKLLLGAVHLSKKQPDKVLALHGSGDDRGLLALRQCTEALLILERKDEALATAKKAFDKHPSNPLSAFLVALVYVARGEDREALAVLSIAPPFPAGLKLRGHLLLKLDQVDLARQVQESILYQSGWRDIDAWKWLQECFRRLERGGEFVEMADKVIAANVLRADARALSVVHALKAKSLEQMAQIPQALAACEEAIRLDGSNVVALNDAAWHIAQTMPARIADARDYIDRALKLVPNVPALLDTAARVRLMQGEHQAALDYMDRVIQGAPSPHYKLHRVDVLLAMGRKDDAKTALEAIVREAPKSPEAAKAKELILSLEEPPAPPEEDPGN